MTSIVKFRRGLRALSSSLTRYEDQCADCCQLTLAQCEILDSLAHLAPCSLTELAQDLDVDVSTASRSVDTMCRRELVSRATDPADRRRIVLSLTRNGELLANQLACSGISLAQAVLAGLAPERQEAVTAAVLELSTAIDQALVRATCCPAGNREA